MDLLSGKDGLNGKSAGKILSDFIWFSMIFYDFMVFYEVPKGQVTKSQRSCDTLERQVMPLLKQKKLILAPWCETAECFPEIEKIMDDA